ncbi:MAG: ATP-binding protein [Vulcanimicrobiota bacterium]
MDEGARLEAKRGGRVGKSCMETVCAFANTIGLCGGWILFGVQRNDELGPVDIWHSEPNAGHFSPPGVEFSVE